MFKKVFSTLKLLTATTSVVLFTVTGVAFWFIQATTKKPSPTLLLAGARSIGQRGTTTVAVYKHAPLDHQAISGAIVEASRLGYDYHSNITTCQADSNFCMTTLVFTR